jgi:hypothetical protein
LPIKPYLSLQIILAGVDLYVEIWGTAMRIQTARKRKNRFGSCKEIRDIIIPSEECIGIAYWSYITAKTKFADKTMVKTVMLMGKL